MIMNN